MESCGIKMIKLLIQKNIIFSLVFFMSIFASMFSHAEETLEVSVISFEDVSSESCVSVVSEFLKKHQLKIDDDLIAIHANQVCQLNQPSLILFKKVPLAQKDPHQFSLDLMGSYTSGNKRTENIKGGFTYKGEMEPHEVTFHLEGEHTLENDGAVYHRFEVLTTYQYYLSSHWSLFAFAIQGRDQKKQIAFVAKEIGGVMYNFYNHKDTAALKLSLGVGHQFENWYESDLEADSNQNSFNHNQAIASYRIKYANKFFENSLELMAALWYQHVLFEPPSEFNEEQMKYIDPKDFRVFFEFELKNKIAKLRRNPGVSLYANWKLNYEYFSDYVTDSPYDLTLSGGLELRF